MKLHWERLPDLAVLVVGSVLVGVGTGSWLIGIGVYLLASLASDSR